jgi:thiosulfate/3-mercaptopyruvate sulfurtransferase
VSGFGSLVDTAWLAANLAVPDLRVVDASWYLPTERRDAEAEYRNRHIPGAVFFDIDEIADTSSTYPHMLPDPVKFSARARRLGLGDGNRIVAYDGGTGLASFRVWWMFRVFGHADVAVLDGGLAKWLAEGRASEDAPPPPRERHFTPRANSLLVRDIGQMRANLASGREQVLDARSAGRFAATVPEPRPGLRGGHIPGARNLPFDRLFDPATRTLKPDDELRRLFVEAGIDLSRPVVCTCGSGVSACVLAFALDRLGHKDVAVYDGSWSEWGAQPDTPIATGAG